MAICSNCKTEVGNAKFCPECGTKIPKQKTMDEQVDEFFRLLESASKEDKDEFFKWVESEIQRKKAQQNS